MAAREPHLPRRGERRAGGAGGQVMGAFHFKGLVSDPMPQPSMQAIFFFILELAIPVTDLISFKSWASCWRDSGHSDEGLSSQNPVRWPTTACNSGSKESGALFWPG